MCLITDYRDDSNVKLEPCGRHIGYNTDTQLELNTIIKERIQLKSCHVETLLQL